MKRFALSGGICFASVVSKRLDVVFPLGKIAFLCRQDACESKDHKTSKDQFRHILVIEQRSGSNERLKNLVGKEHSLSRQSNGFIVTFDQSLVHQILEIETVAFFDA